jgi:hypothetical protein
MLVQVKHAGQLAQQAGATGVGLVEDKRARFKFDGVSLSAVFEEQPTCNVDANGEVVVGYSCWLLAP